MTFKVGDKVKLVNYRGGKIAAPLGALATITRQDKKYVYVEWEIPKNTGWYQMDGGYYPRCFELAQPPALQVIFDI